LSQLVR